jgi:hypothetical protein
LAAPASVTDARSSRGIAASRSAADARRAALISLVAISTSNRSRASSTAAAPRCRAVASSVAVRRGSIHEHLKRAQMLISRQALLPYVRLGRSDCAVRIWHAELYIMDKARAGAAREPSGRNTTSSRAQYPADDHTLRVISRIGPSRS